MSAVLKLVQGSPGWHAHRQSMRNASETPAVLGISPWVSPYQLWLVKTGRVVQETTAAMRHGSDLEPAARVAYEAKTGSVMQPLVMQDGLYSASLDGITLGGDLIVEIKCPVRGRKSELWQGALAGDVPDHYMVQIQHQLMVSGAVRAHLWVFNGRDGVLVEVGRNDLLMARIRQAWDAFQIFLDVDQAPPLLHEDTLVREDAAWLRAAQSYVTFKEAYDDATAKLASAKETLLALVDAPRQGAAAYR